MNLPWCGLQIHSGNSKEPYPLHGEEVGCGVVAPRRPAPLSPAPLSPVTQWVAFCPHKVPFTTGRRARAGVEAGQGQAKF